MRARSNPFEEMERMFERMSRQFEDASQSWSSEGPMGRWAEEFESAAVDLVDRGEAFAVTVDLPGFEPDDVDVQLTDQTLRIQANRETGEDEESDRYVRHERRQTSVQRSIWLPEAVEETGVNAEMQNGVLTVTLPKREDESARDIEIE